MKHFHVFLADGSAVSSETFKNMILDNLRHLSMDDPAFTEQLNMLSELAQDVTQNSTQNAAIPKLAAAIEAKEDEFMVAHRVGNKLLKTFYLHEAEGLKEAFEIVAGESYVDYLLRTAYNA